MAPATGLKLLKREVIRAKKILAVYGKKSGASYGIYLDFEA